MSLQRKTVKVLTILVLSICLVGGLVAFANKDVQYKTFQSEKFGFTISYPASWKKVYRDGEENPQDISSLRLSSIEAPQAVVTVMVNELNSTTSLKELKRFQELRRQLFGDPLEEIKIGEFAGLRAVTAQSTIVGEKMATGEDGSEKLERMAWKAQWIGLISDGYLYRIITSAPQEKYGEVSEKYLSRILDSFELENS